MSTSFTPATPPPTAAPSSKIKLNRRGLLELITGCAFLALLTAVIWSSQIGGGHVLALDAAAPESQGWIIWRTLHDPVVMFTTIVAEFVLLLAFVLALVPPAWWLRADHILGTVPATSTTPLRWLEHKLQSSRSQPANEAQPVVGPNGEPIYYEQQVMTGIVVNPFNLPPGQIVPGQAMPGPSAAPSLPQGAPVPAHLPTPVAVTGQPLPGQALPGQPVPGQMQPGQVQPGQADPNQPGQPVQGQLQPGQAQPGQAQPISATPATVTEVQPGQTAPPPAAPLSEVLNFEETQEDDPIADLANLTDILTSAFDEDAGVDPDVEALARSLPEVDILLVQTTGEQILARFRQSRVPG